MTWWFPFTILALAACAAEFVWAEQNIREELPLSRAVEITFTPTHAGELRYPCGMGMQSGKIVAK